MTEEIRYGNYEEAYKAIHSALNTLMAPSFGKKITKFAFTWNADKTPATLKTYDSGVLLFTVTFTWNPDGTLMEVERT